MCNCDEDPSAWDKRSGVAWVGISSASLGLRIKSIREDSPPSHACIATFVASLSDQVQQCIKSRGQGAKRPAPGRRPLSRFLPKAADLSHSKTHASGHRFTPRPAAVQPAHRHRRAGVATLRHSKRLSRLNDRGAGQGQDAVTPVLLGHNIEKLASAGTVNARGQ